jgi:hypothetical protein
LHAELDGNEPASTGAFMCRSSCQCGHWCACTGRRCMITRWFGDMEVHTGAALHFFGGGESARAWLRRRVAPPALGRFFVAHLPALTDRPNLCRPCGARLLARLRFVAALRAGGVCGAGGLGKAVAEPPHSKSSRRWRAGQEGDPSSRKALLRMRAKNGLGKRTRRLGEAHRSGGKDAASAASLLSRNRAGFARRLRFERAERVGAYYNRSINGCLHRVSTQTWAGSNEKH